MAKLEGLVLLGLENASTHEISLEKAITNTVQKAIESQISITNRLEKEMSTKLHLQLQFFWESKKYHFNGEFCGHGSSRK